jgi:hypothetical protein
MRQIVHKMGRTAVPLLIAAAFAFPAHAATLIGTFKGNECAGGGFSTCYAHPDGTTDHGEVAGGSPTIYKANSDGSSDISTKFPSIDGSEFTVNYTGGTNTLSFNYVPGAKDPVIHYFAIFQANTTQLFYDAAGITSGSVALTPLFPKNPGFSHITFFDSGSALPETSTWGMLILGLGAVGGALRRRNRPVRQLSYAA